ncbi:MAG: DNA-processing protein DprA [Eubacterium sp.]|nr:DNA-processing protein DprA [Eubacterium sp.]
MQVQTIHYWLWLQKALGVGASIKKLLAHFGTAGALYHSSIIDWKTSCCLTEKQIEKLAATELASVQRTVDICERNGWEIISYEDVRYPDCLRNIKNPPAVLFVRGYLPAFDRTLSISVVGTREASPYGLKSARLLSKGLAKGGAVIVSGGALGIDSEAHKGALEAGGVTCVVLGSPLDSSYLKTNAALREKIVQNGGALVTEFPPGAAVGKGNFPIRNRIISGLSDAVLVIEAGVKSGSAITAKIAMEQGRDVFAVPSSILDIHFCSTNELIENGAFVATSPKSVLRHYADCYVDVEPSRAGTMYQLLAEENGMPVADAPQPKQYTFEDMEQQRAAQTVRTEAYRHLNETETVVYEAICDGVTAIYELSEKTNLSEQRLLSTLTVLEIKGLITKLSGSRYQAK